jgi:hypothetical protein
MVLTVDVVGNRSAHGNEAGAGRDGKKPSLRKEYVDDVGEADAAFATKQASGFVETEDAIETAAVDQSAAGIETRVAVAAAEAIREQGSGRSRLKNFRDLVVPSRLVDVMVRDFRVTSPRENSLDGRRGCGLLAQGCGGLTGHT